MGVLGTQDEVGKGSGKSQLLRKAEENCESEKRCAKTVQSSKI